MNARNTNQLTWEYIKKKERNELPNDALAASTITNWRQRYIHQTNNHQFPRYNNNRTNNPQLQRYSNQTSNHQNNSNMNRSHHQSQHADPTCYGCGENGHIQRNCMNRLQNNNYPHDTTNQLHQFNRNIRE